MDRSSLRFVQTDDYEKRLAFKERLAKQIDPSEEPKIESRPEWFSVGDTVSHPSLGVCEIYSMNWTKNELVLIKDNQRIPLVFSQVKSFISSVKEPDKTDGWNESVFGDVIDRTPLHRPDVAYRYVDQTEVASKEVEIPSLPVGVSVWHPELGLCTVHSVDEKANSVVLRVQNKDLEVDLVLSQALTKLQVADRPADHVPFKPFRKEIKGSPVKDINHVSVELPNSFKDWSLDEKFYFLTRNQKLLTEEINDVLAVIDGKSPLFYKVTVGWKEPEIIPAKADFVLDEDGNVPDNLSVGTRVWYPELGACTVDFVTDKEIGFVFEDGSKVTSVLSHIKSKLVVLENDQPVEPAAKKVGFKVVEPKPEPVREEPVILPPREIKPDNYYHSPVEEPLQKVETGFGVNREVEEIETIIKETKVSKISVSLPMAFKSWTQSDQYIYLSRSKKLSPNEANDVITVYTGEKPQSNIEYEIKWEEI